VPPPPPPPFRGRVAPGCLTDSFLATNPGAIGSERKCSALVQGLTISHVCRLSVQQSIWQPAGEHRSLLQPSSSIIPD